MIRCGNPVHKSINAAAEAHHDSVAQVRLCYVRPVRSLQEREADEIADTIAMIEAEYEYDADAAYEQFLERQETSDGPFGADGLYDYERERGCISYEEARRRAEEANEDHAQEVRAGI